MEKPNRKCCYLTDWNSKLTDDWIAYAQTAQSSHCRNINAHIQGGRYTEDLFHKIDDLVLMHAFGASTKKGVPHSDIKMNFNAEQRRAAEKVRKMILKYGKIKTTKTNISSVVVQVISVTMMLVDSPEDTKKDDKKIPGLAQVAVFRVLKPNKTFCFIDHNARYYADWNDYINNNQLPRCKMCFPKHGIYRYKQVNDDNNNETRHILDLGLAESNSCTDWERFKSFSLKVVPYASLIAGVVCIVAAPFTGGATLGIYASYAAATAGWVSFGCMLIGAAVNLNSMWDKFWHDESYLNEIASLSMILLHYGVAKYNARMLDKFKSKTITPVELGFMTVINCFRCAVDSVMFLTTCVNLIMKACSQGIGSITAVELVQFSMSAYFFGKTLFEPKTGFGIIKEAQRKYLEAKRSTIPDKGAQEKFDELVKPDERFGDGGKLQTMKDDWKGITCSQEVCDELNANGALIQNIDCISDLGQFFLEVSDTNSNLSMTENGKIMVNEKIEMDGKQLNEMNIGDRRPRLLEGTALLKQGDNDVNFAMENQESMTGAENLERNNLGLKRHNQGMAILENLRSNEGMTFLDDIIGPPPPPQNTEYYKEFVVSSNTAQLVPMPNATKSHLQVQAPAAAVSSSTECASDVAVRLNTALLALNKKRMKYNSYSTTSDDDSDDEHECICKSRTISVLYANIRSINPKNPKLKPKIDKLKNLISLYRPQLIVIVETWLTDKHKNIDVLRSLNLEATYEIFRQDRVDGHDPRNASGHTNDDNKTQGRRGGGVIVLWKKGTYPKTEISFKRSYNEDYADNIVNFDLIRTYCCKKCYGDKKKKKFIFTVVYRRPSPNKKEDRNEFKKTDQEIMNRLTHLCMTYDDPDPSWDYSGLTMVGDFNFDGTKQGGIESLDSITYRSDCARMPLSSPITHKSGAALDQVFASPCFVVDSRDNSTPVVEVLDFVSDHAALLFSLYLGKDKDARKSQNCPASKCV